MVILLLQKIMYFKNIISKLAVNFHSHISLRHSHRLEKSYYNLSFLFYLKYFSDFINSLQFYLTFVSVFCVLYLQGMFLLHSFISLESCQTGAKSWSIRFINSLLNNTKINVMYCGWKQF